VGSAAERGTEVKQFHYDHDAPLWEAYVYPGDVKSRHEVSRLCLGTNISYHEAKRRVEEYLESRYPGRWYDETNDPDSGYYNITTLDWVCHNPGQFYLTSEALWPERLYHERAKAKAEEMLALLEELAPDDKRVKALIQYIEEMPE
jgi:hypothetical protein